MRSRFYSSFIFQEVNLDKTDEMKFRAIQKKFLLKNKAEVLRFCMNKVYTGMILDIDKDVSFEIIKIISSSYIKVKYALTNVNDFIRRVISEFLTTLKKEWSLKNWSIQQTLSQEENDTTC